MDGKLPITEQKLESYSTKCEQTPYRGNLFMLNCHFLTASLKHKLEFLPMGKNYINLNI